MALLQTATSQSAPGPLRCQHCAYRQETPGHQEQSQAPLAVSSTAGPGLSEECIVQEPQINWGW